MDITHCVDTLQISNILPNHVTYSYIHYDYVNITTSVRHNYENVFTSLFVTQQTLEEIRNKPSLIFIARMIILNYFS